MYGQRQKSRDRSRDREKRYNRSPSQQSEYRKHRHRDPQMSHYNRPKRVKFDQNADIRVFRKEDEPSAKGLSEQDVNRLKSELEKEVARISDFGWEQARHRELLNERHSRKEQKDKQKLLMDRLGAVKESLSYSCPVSILGLSPIIELGCDSEERLGHTHRINDILGCYYTSLGQIPDDPLQQLLNNNSPYETKTIKFDNDHFTNNLSYAAKKPPEKALKGILKMPLAPATEPRPIDPQLIVLLKDLKINPSQYTKERTEQLLKPYKDSGQLEYLTKNKDVLEMMLRNIGANPPPRASISVSAGRESHDRSSQPHNFPGQMHYGHTFVPKADKYRTVPCKYYHSHLGCNKIDNCTYIHDERYAGVPVPPNYVPPHQSNQPLPKGPGSYQPGMYNNAPPYGRPPPVPSSQSNYMTPPSYSNPNYYANSGPPNATNYSSGGPSHFSGSNYSGSNPGGNYSGNNPNYRGNGPTYPGGSGSNYPNNRPNYPPSTPGANYGGNNYGSGERGGRYGSSQRGAEYQGGQRGRQYSGAEKGGYPPPANYGGNPPYMAGNPPPNYQQNYYMNYGGYYGGQNGGGGSSGSSKPN